jgi:hypothetical protein
MLRSAPRALRAIVQLLLLAIVAGAALLYAPPIGAVSAETLQRSLAREVGGSTALATKCERQAAGLYHCLVAEPGSSGGTTYQLRRRGRRCWDAVRIGLSSSAHLSQSASGCAKLRDQARI